MLGRAYFGSFLLVCSGVAEPLSAPGDEGVFLIVDNDTCFCARGGAVGELEGDCDCDTGSFEAKLSR